MTGLTKSWTEGWHWIALLSITVLINIPMLSPTLLFSGDMLHALVFFHFAYSELILHHAFPRWVPYLGFGTVFDFNLFNSIQPTDYVVMAAGWLCGITDALLLYKISMILCQAVLVLGLYLLSERFFTSKLSVWMVCLGGLLTTSWFSSPWGLTAYYMMPLLLWFLLRFLESKKPAYLWLAGLTEGLSLLGTVPYIAPLHLFIVVAFLIPFLGRDPGLWRAFANWRNFVHPLFFTFCGYFLLLGLWIAGIDVVWMAPHRDPESGNVPLDLFLGRETGFERQPLGVLLRLLAKGDFYYGDTVIYMGILPLATLAYGLLRRRDTLFLSVAAVALALYWFSLGGWLTTLTYYGFPMMKKYRFISASWCFLRIFLLLLGGFGFDQLLRDLRGQPAPAPNVFSRRARSTIIIVLACCGLDHLWNCRADFDTNTSFFFSGRTWPEVFAQQCPAVNLAGFEIDHQVLLMLRYLAYAAIFGLFWLLTLRLRRTGRIPELVWIKVVGPALLILYLADVGFFFTQILKQGPWCPPDTPVDDVLTVHETIYRTQAYEETNLPVDAARVRHVIECKRSGLPDQQLFASASVLMQADFAVPGTRMDLIMPSIKEMVDARASPSGAPTTPVQRYEAIKRDTAFRRSVGDGLDKARMVRDSDIVFAPSEQQALQVFRTLPNPDQKVVVQGMRMPASGEAPAGPGPLGKVEPELFSANRVVFRVPADASGWLFYADAYAPGWQALVDGKPAQVFRANVGFKAVQVPTGAHDVTFYFDDGWRELHFLALVGVSALLSFALTGLLLAAPWVLKSSPAPAPRQTGENLPLGAQATELRFLPVWSAAAWLAALAGGLFLYVDFFCPALLIFAVAALVVFIVHNRVERKQPSV